MDDNLSTNELSQWLSTYGLITAERILGKFHIQLPHAELQRALKNPMSFYHCLLQVPLKNVLNGIILQQANDYHVYVQKLYIDYLLSGENSKDPESQGATIRESLEAERKTILAIGEEFSKLQKEHEVLIASTQKKLIQSTEEWKKSVQKGINAMFATLAEAKQSITKDKAKKSIEYALINVEPSQAQSDANHLSFIDKINEHLKANLSIEVKASLVDDLKDLLAIIFSFKTEIDDFKDKVNQITVKAKRFRMDFFNATLRTLELMRLLPEYKINEAQDKINREPLYFDKSLGGI